MATPPRPTPTDSATTPTDSAETPTDSSGTSTDRPGTSTDRPASVPTGAPDRIQLRGLRVLGTHGVLAEERDRAQPFEVDVDLLADLTAAGASDDLGDTVDYGAVVTAVVDEVGGKRAALLEHLAQRVADAVLAAAGDRAVEVEVEVRKLRPPVPADLASSGVRIRRRPAP